MAQTEAGASKDLQLLRRRQDQGPGAALRNEKSLYTPTPGPVGTGE